MGTDTGSDGSGNGTDRRDARIGIAHKTASAKPSSSICCWYSPPVRLLGVGVHVILGQRECQVAHAGEEEALKQQARAVHAQLRRGRSGRLQRRQHRLDGGRRGLGLGLCPASRDPACGVIAEHGGGTGWRLELVAEQGARPLQRERGEDAGTGRA